MPFGSITSDTTVYEPRRPGVYQKQGIALGQPNEEIRFSASSQSSKSPTVAIGGTLIFQKANVVTEKVDQLIINYSVQLPKNGNITVAEVSSKMLKLHGAINTTDRLSRLASGEI